MGFTTTDVDTIVTNAAACLHGVVLLASADGGDVTIYDGTDPAGGRKVGIFKGPANHSKVVRFSPPLCCEHGIYVDVGSSVTEVLVHWDPA